MNGEDLITRVEILVRLDADAVVLYDRVLERMAESELRERILQIRNDHHRHVEILTSVVLSSRGVPPKMQDISDLFRRELQELEGSGSMEQMLAALLRLESIINKEYEDAVNLELDPKIDEIMDDNFLDEQQHIRFIRAAAQDRIWEQGSSGI